MRKIGLCMMASAMFFLSFAVMANAQTKGIHITAVESADPRVPLSSLDFPWAKATLWIVTSAGIGNPVAVTDCTKGKENGCAGNDGVMHFLKANLNGNGDLHGGLYYAKVEADQHQTKTFSFVYDGMNGVMQDMVLPAFPVRIVLTSLPATIPAGKTEVKIGLRLTNLYPVDLPVTLDVIVEHAGAEVPGVALPSPSISQRGQHNSPLPISVDIKTGQSVDVEWSQTFSEYVALGTVKFTAVVRYRPTYPDIDISVKYFELLRQSPKS